MNTQGKVTSEQLETLRVKTDKVLGGPSIVLLANLPRSNPWHLQPWVAQVSDQHGPAFQADGQEASDCLQALEREVDKESLHQSGESQEPRVRNFLVSVDLRRLIVR